MATFNNSRDLIAHLRQAAGEQQKEVIVTTQAWLGSSKNSPRDTGRFRSSWFAAEGVSSSEVAPERDQKKVSRIRRRRAKDATKSLGRDAGTPQDDAKGLSVNLGSTYHLTNNLPYAAPIALGVNTPPSWGGVNQVKSAPATWFIEFRNTGIEQIADAAGRVIKRRFGL